MTSYPQFIVGRVDAAVAHRLQDAGGGDAERQVEEGAIGAGAATGLRHRPLLDQLRGVVVGGIESVVGRRRNGGQCPLEPRARGWRRRTTEPIGFGLVERPEIRRDVGNQRARESRMIG